LGPKDNSIKDKEFHQDRLMVLLALAVQARTVEDPEVVAQTGEREACPCPEDLAAWSEGRLGPRDRSAIIAHIDSCSDCLRELMAVGRFPSPQDGIGD
jgi:hypothetical protein